MDKNLQGAGTDVNDFYEVKSSMLAGSQVIVDNIWEKAKEFNDCNEKFLIEQDKLKRINIYAYKQQLPSLPKVKVDRIASHLVVKVIFDHFLPKNSYINVNLTSGDQTQFCSQLVVDKETIIEMSVAPEILNDTVDLTFDLITFCEKDQSWCIIRNCIKESLQRDRMKIRQQLDDKKKFLQVKLNILKDIMESEDGHIDMDQISNIKKSIRKEIVDL